MISYGLWVMYMQASNLYNWPVHTYVQKSEVPPKEVLNFMNISGHNKCVCTSHYSL